MPLSFELCALNFARQLTSHLNENSHLRNKVQSTKYKHKISLDSRSHVHDLDIWAIAVILNSRFCRNFDEKRCGPGLARGGTRICIFQNLPTCDGRLMIQQWRTLKPPSVCVGSIVLVLASGTFELAVP